MDIDDYSLINRSPSNTRNGHEEIPFEENNGRNEPSSSLVSENTLKTSMKDDIENDTCGAVRMDLPLEEHQPRSRTRKSDPLRVHNCNDCLPPLETEQQFRIAVTKCARGGDSMERVSSDGAGVAREVPNLSPLFFKTKPIIISSSPIMKECSFAKEKRKTAAEIDAFFTRLSTPKHIKGKVSKEKIAARVQQMSIAQRRNGEATKGLCVNVVRKRSNSTARSRTSPSNIGK